MSRPPTYCTVFTEYSCHSVLINNITTVAEIIHHVCALENMDPDLCDLVDLYSQQTLKRYNTLPRSVHTRAFYIIDSAEKDSIDLECSSPDGD